MVEPKRPQTTQHGLMRFASLLTKATETHVECVILIAFSTGSCFLRMFAAISNPGDAVLQSYSRPVGGGSNYNT